MLANDMLGEQFKFSLGQYKYARRAGNIMHIRTSTVLAQHKYWLSRNIFLPKRRSCTLTQGKNRKHNYKLKVAESEKGKLLV